MITLIVFCTFRVTLNIPNQDLVEKERHLQFDCYCQIVLFNLGFHAYISTSNSNIQ